MTAVATRSRRFGALHDVANGVVAVGVKELRGRMRGRRAFVVLTLHLLLVAGFAWMIETFAERTVSCGFGSLCTVSSDIGRQLFVGLTFLLTLIVLVLAPASTAGAISLEREKQTLDLLATTPISSLAIVLGKLLSALSWVFLLMLASIPVAALVFTFGGVGPEDLVKSYVVLFATAIAFGAVGLFVSAFVKRTHAATVINLVAVITLTVGATVLFIFWTVVTGSQGFLPDQARGLGDQGPIASLTRRPPEAILYLNPFLSQVDVVCGTDNDYGASCSIITAVTNRAGVAFADPGAQLIGVPRDTFWPRATATMIALSVLLIVLSAQLVSPTRRLRLRRRRPAPPATAGEP